jgi:hypothetical protein
MAKARRTVEIFLSLGTTAALLSSALGSAALANGQHQQPVDRHGHWLAEGGEGGEGGEGCEAHHQPAVNSTVDLLVVLAQMQGHLLVAQDLLGMKEFQAAEPHVGHPIDELYGAIAPALAERGIPPFLSTLEALRQQVRLDPGASSTLAKLQQAQARIGSVERALQAAAGGNGTAPEVVQGLVQSAVSEYEGAVAQGQIVEVIEYQDARGFLKQAQQILQQARQQAQQQPGRDPSRLVAMAQVITTMLEAFPSVLPPKRALQSPEALKALAGRL